MITLYDFELSGSCYMIRLFPKILGQKHERVNVDFVNKEHKNDKYMGLNRFGEIPILHDGEVRLRDAQAIMVYLAKKDKTNQWYPDDAVAMGSRSWTHTWWGESSLSSGIRPSVTSRASPIPRWRARAASTSLRTRACSPGSSA